MRKYELSVTKDYVPEWTVVDAIRELFQNAIDQQVSVEGNDMFFAYSEEEQVLKIGNKKSVLDPKTLLLGSSTKQDDDNTIGRFGEGYKIATLVLVRLGKKVTFYNYGAREVWNPRFVKSRRYGAEILTFFVDKKYPWTTVPDNNLTIVVEGITPEEYKDIVASNLHLDEPTDYYETEYGRILFEEKYAGKVFVNGLFVCKYEPYVYGYDFKPNHIKLDRDRKLVCDFDLKWLASSMWCKVSGENMLNRAANLVADGASDVRYIADVIITGGNIKELSEVVYQRFIKEFGTHAIPVSNNAEALTVPKGYNPVIVDPVYQKIIKKSSQYIQPEEEFNGDFLQKVENWLNIYKQEMSWNAYETLKNIIQEEKDKYGKSKNLPF